MIKEYRVWAEPYTSRRDFNLVSGDIRKAIEEFQEATGALPDVISLNPKNQAQAAAEVPPDIKVDYIAGISRGEVWLAREVPAPDPAPAIMNDTPIPDAPHAQTLMFPLDSERVSLSVAPEAPKPATDIITRKRPIVSVGKAGRKVKAIYTNKFPLLHDLPLEQQAEALHVSVRTIFRYRSRKEKAHAL